MRIRARRFQLKRKPQEVNGGLHYSLFAYIQFAEFKVRGSNPGTIADVNLNMRLKRTSIPRAVFLRIQPLKTNHAISGITFAGRDGDAQLHAVLRLWNLRQTSHAASHVDITPTALKPKTLIIDPKALNPKAPDGKGSIV